MNIRCDYCGVEFWKRDDRIGEINFCKLAHRNRYMLISGTKDGHWWLVEINRLIDQARGGGDGMR